ncbi:MAG TPA: hypothetical protein ENI20_05100 [Bacteroides sp.]|nr:hypothetical protein [Bacteroides sp.]
MDLEKNSLGYLWIVFIVLGLLGNVSNINSQAVVIHSSQLASDYSINSPFTYCSLILNDTVEGISPGGKSFGIVGWPFPANEADADPPGLTNERVAGSFTGRAFLDLALLPANFELTYKADANRWPVTIVAPDVVTLDPYVGTYCESDAAFALSGGLPLGGYYTVNGAQTATFDPGSGAGTNTVYYYTGSGSCLASSSFQTITVNADPTVSFLPLSDVCITEPAFVLTQGSPAGGIYSGAGVAGGIFDPNLAGIGAHPITYTYSNGTCSDNNGQTIQVGAIPAVNFAGLAALYCNSDPPVPLIGTPAGAGGVFTGNGITDNGDGTAVFNPATSGLGTYNISYTYTEAFGCDSTITKQVQVGTLLTLTGIDPVYCEDAANVLFTYNPSGPAGSFTALAGLTDNGDGTGSFDPALAAPGFNTIEYTYTDVSGCVSVLQQQVEIALIPNVTFVGLAANHCANESNITLTGNQAPLGSFSGLGITDNGDGTAIFNPSALVVGGPYDITYTFTEPVTGCFDSQTSQTNILSVPTGNITGTSTICSGASTDLTVSFTGTGLYDFTYTDGTSVFTRNGVGSPYIFPVSPTSTSTYTLASITQTADGCGNTGTGSAAVTVNPQVQISKQPVSQSVCPGDNILFTIESTGVGLSYQWQKDGVPIPGEINPNLPLNNIDASYAGTYSCIVSSSCGGPLTSNGAVLTLLPQTIINTQPANQTGCEGNNINFTLAATGSNLNYQWKKGGIPMSDGGRISGVNTNNLLITGVISTDVAAYKCTVSGDCGDETSIPVVLTVNQNILITGQPVSTSVCPDDTISFGVTATGTSLTYQWQKNGAPMLPETNSSLIIEPVTLADAGIYQCVVTGACPTRYSTAAVLTVNEPLAITSNPLAEKEKCVGEDVTYAVSATGTGLSYQWRKDGTDMADGGNISGTSLTTLIITGLVSGDEGIYTCIVSGSCGSTGSLPSKLVVDETPVITTQPSDKTVCKGGNTSFSINATGPNLNYQWQKAGIDMPGETNTFLANNNAGNSDEATYHCIVTNACGDLTSSDVDLIVNDSTVIVIQPASDSLCEGGNINFSLVANGTGLSYQWQKNGFDIFDGGSISGALSSNLAITGLVPADAGTYHCIVTGSCGILSSDPATVVIDDNINITAQPASQEACKQDNVIFSVTATGSSLDYQWQFNGTDLGGETAATLVLNSVTTADEGDYNCIITNLCSTESTDVVSLIVNDSTQIITDPADVTTCEAANTSFNVLATGANLVYQWEKNGVNLADGANLSGSLTDQLVISGLLPGDAGIYTCEVAGSCGTFESAPASLVVNEEVYITTQPAAITVCPGDNASFGITATGSGLSYQWQKNGSDIVGEINPSLSLNNITAIGAGIYRCVVTGSCRTINSNSVNLAVNEDLAFTSQPVDQDKCEGETVSFSVAVTGSNPVYQWQKDGANLIDAGNISGSNTKDLTLSGLLLADGGNYTCVVTGSCNSKTSNAGILSVDEAITITTQPLNMNACEHDNVILNVAATGSNPGYQWQKDFISIPGETNSSLVLDSISPADAGDYTCILTNACGSVASSISKVIIHPSTTILSDPSDVTDCEGGSAGFSVDANGYGLIYQWKKNGVNLNDVGSVLGTDTKNLSISPLINGDAGVYTCEVTGTCGIVSSGSASLTVNENILILTQPISAIVCPGNNVSYYVNASGTNLSYQWQKNGTDIPSETNQTLVIDSVLAADAGVYRCVISGACPPVLSNAVSLTVNQDVAITIQPVSKQVCENDNISFNVAATGTGITYQWKKNGADLIDAGNITGSQTSVLGIGNINLADFGTYTCLVSGTCNSDNSNTATLTVVPNTDILVQPVDFIAINSGDASFSVSVAGSDLTFQWQKDGTDLSNGGVFSGVDTNILYLAGVSETEEGTYTCLVSGTCGSDNSDPGYLTVNDTAVITVQPSGNQVKCAGESANFDVVASGTNLSYQWKKNGTSLIDGGNLTGATTAALQISNVQPADAGNYSCLVTADEGSETSLASALVVNELTQVTTHPADLNRCVGDDAMLAVTASGSNLIYQWRKDAVDLSDGGNLSGSNSNILNITNLTQADAGDYYCVISGDCNDDNSTPARITVNRNTLITVQASNKVKCEGESATFSVDADGDSLVYQWKKDGIDLADGGNVSGATSKDLTIANLQLSDAGGYNCYVQGACGFETSSAASLTVNPETGITLQPLNQEFCENEEAVFIIETTGTNLGFQWMHDGADLTDAGNISGSLTSILTVSNADTSHSGVYQCVVTGLCSDDMSDPVSLLVHPAVQILSGPVDEIRCEGTSATFSVSAFGDSLTYQWKKNGVNISDGPTVNGSSKKDLTLTDLSAADAGAYNCLVSSMCGSGNTTAANLTVTASTRILVQPSHRTVNEGESLSFSVSASPIALLTYQWEKDGVALADVGDINGSLTSVLDIANADVSDAGSYSCIVTGPCGVITSDPANLNVNLVTQILTHPSDQSVCEGTSVVLSVTATGSNITYEWKKDGVSLVDVPSVISGSTTNNLTILTTVSSDAGSYLCIVTGDGGNLNTNTAVISITPLTSILTEPSSTYSKCAGEGAYFVINAIGDSLIYQWNKDGANFSDAGNISGSGTNVLSISNLTSADEGVFRISVTGTCGTVTSEPSTLSVTDLPGIPGVITGDNVICQGESIIVYEVPEITGASSYGWILPYDAIIVSGNGSRFIEVSFSFNSVDGDVRVYGINSCGSGPESAGYPVTVNPVPVADAGWDQVVCADTAVLAANPSAFGTWTVFNGTAVISNPNQNDSPVQNLS